MSYIEDDFLLDSNIAEQLYNEWAKDMPIIDYHNHLPPAQVALNHEFSDIAEAWLAGDHYKWRAMRANGIDESLCTGNAPGREKFQAWAETVPKLLRNQLYPWTHLELKRIFGIDGLLSGDTAESVWNTCTNLLATPEFSAPGLLAQSNVKVICTTDDPTDSLEHHIAFNGDNYSGLQMFPAWRPDKGMAIEKPRVFNDWLDKLGEVADIEIRNLDSYFDALRRRHDFFHAQGCRLSDHGLDTFYAESYTDAEISMIFDELRMSVAVNEESIRKFKSAMLYEFGVMDAEKNWTQQYHVGAIRNVNSRMFDSIGPDTGYDCIGDGTYAEPMVRLFDRLNSEDKLARTIVYNINPRDNDLLVSILGAFQDGVTPGKMQHGSGWWFMDQKDGMEQQIDSLSQNGLLSRFVGMLTDSRSFLSFPRHEYFRRILCNMLANDMNKGLIPKDMGLVGGLIQDVCYNNAVDYFGFDAD
jgi:glucuronate isomerase